LRNPKFSGAFVTCDEPGHGQLNIEYDSASDHASDFDEVRCRKLVRDAFGLPDLQVEILDIRPWDMSALTADRMSFGRVFLAGDCAHVMPPVGGLGGQTAIQDAADLAWKLALVVKGHAAPSLLDTYEAERKPVARIAIARQIANYVERLLPAREDLRIRDEEHDILGTAIGYRYRSSAIVSDDLDDGAATENPLQPSGSPGTRLAHVWLCRGEETISSHDLIGRDFVLFAGSDGAEWIDAARRIALRSGAPLSCSQLSVDVDDPQGLFLPRLGVSSKGATLVRPDGYIAWRSRGADSSPISTLETNFARIRGETSLESQIAPAHSDPASLPEVLTAP
jgi:putative polyketide hydroxylase